MEPVRSGRQLRALRRRQRLRQDDVALRSGTSRSEAGRTERGDWRHLRVSTLDRIATAVGARLDVRLSWNGEALDRLLDASHASLVEQTVRRLRADGWLSAVEVSFNIRGERGSIDILAFHPSSATVLVVEVKSVVPDVQATLMTLDRKARLGLEVASDRGWIATRVGRVLVAAESRTSRRRVEAHQALFAAALPSRAVAVRLWLHSPRGPGLAGLLFLSSGLPAAARHRISGRAGDASPPVSVNARGASGHKPSSGPPGDG